MKNRKQNIAKAVSTSDMDTEDENALKPGTTASGEVVEENGGKEKPKESVTIQKVLVRSATACVFMALYIALLRMGHLYCIVSIMIVQAELYREFVNIRYVEAQQRQMPWFRSLQWMWFVMGMIAVYGDALDKFCIEHPSLNYVTRFTEQRDNLLYSLYWCTFVVSVLTLKPGLIRFQLSQHMWSVVTVCIVVFQSKFFATNTLNGLFWYFFPFATVVCNDVAAYFAGITCGRKFIKAPFLALSPNKTWEGFLGAFMITMVFSFYFPAFLAQHEMFTCPADGLHLLPFPPPATCTPDAVFQLTTMQLPMNLGSMQLYPIQLHGLAYGLFASLIAPFGGFFMSAIKRAYKKKDFDSFMPGHGGMMDRMDCQLLMTTFTSFYYFAVIAPRAFTVEKMLYHASQMPHEHQVVIWEELGRQLGKL